MHKRSIALLEALADAVTAHTTLLARTGLWPAYSEYLLYDPIVRVSLHLQWEVSCEHKLPKGKPKPSPGDNPRLDFLFLCKREALAIPMEVKWIRDPRKRISIRNDLKKLALFCATPAYHIDARALLIAGRHEIANGIAALLPRLRESKSDPICVRALGKGKQAWGASVFPVDNRDNL